MSSSDPFFLILLLVMCSSDPFFLILLLVMCVIPFQGIIRATPSAELQACL